MTAYLNEYEVASNLTLNSNSPPLEIAPRSGAFRASLSEARSEGEKATLLLRIFLEADSIDDSEEKGKEFSKKISHTLALTTSSTFERPRLTRIIDWTPGIEMREAAVYSELGQLSNPHPVLDQLVADGVSDLLHGEFQPHVKNALGWYREGILGLDPDKKVQAFWLALETLVGGMKWQEKVADQCKSCKSDLYCETCKKISKHKPFPAQKVRLLLRDVINDSDFLFNEVVEARHTLMHGGTLIGPKDGNPFPYNDMIERLGRASRRCLIREVVSPSALLQGKTLRVLEPSTYVRRTYRVKSSCFVTVPLQDGELRPENIPVLTVRLRREEQGFVIHHETIAGSRVDLGSIEKSESADGDD